MATEETSMAHTEADSLTQNVPPIQQTTCCIVGAGPAGAMMALLLARKGIPVILLEAHKDFDREYRADTIHPAILEILEQIGLVDALLQLRHTRMRRMTATTASGRVTLYDFSLLKTRYPYLLLMPQSQFLTFLTAQAQRYPHFQLLMGARVEHLIEEDGKICGVRYRGSDGMHEVRAVLTIGTDGRFSRVRQQAQLKPIQLAAPIDLLWFKLPHKPDDPNGQDGLLYLDRGTFLVLFDRFEYWQVGYGFLKGGYKQLRASGVEGLRSAICALAPWLASHMDALEDWQSVSLLSVEASRLPQWYRPGLLLLGDAAHVMSPLGGSGINMAVQDAVVAANVLSKPLKKDGQVQLRDLAAVQHKRALPTQIQQTYQQLINTRIQRNTENQRASRQPSFLARLVSPLPRLLGQGIQQRIRAYLTAFGTFRPRVK